MNVLDDLGLKEELKEILADAMKRALADKLPIIVGGSLLALILAFIAGRLTKR